MKMAEGLVLKILSWAIALSIIGALGLYLVGGPQAFMNPTVRDMLSTATAVHPENVSESVCAKRFCVESWRTDVGTFIRFSHLGEAEYWETVLGDECRRLGRILVDFSGMKLTKEQKQEVVHLLYGGKDWF